MTDAMFIENMKTALSSTIEAHITPKVSKTEEQILQLSSQMKEANVKLQEADSQLQEAVGAINAPNWVTSERIKAEAVDESKLSTEVQGKLNKEVVTTWEGLRNKPETFPPSTHTHPTSQVVGLSEAIKAQVTPMESRVDTHDRTLASQQDSIQSLTEYRQTVEQHIADITPKVSTNTQGIAGLELTTQGLESSKATKQEVTALSRRVDSLTSSGVASDDILAGVKQAIGSLKVEDPASLASLQGSIEKLNGNIQALESKLKNIKYVVESGGNSGQWYRLWSDGWLEQGGITQYTSNGWQTASTIIFLKQFKDTSYHYTSTSTWADNAYYANARYNIPESKTPKQLILFGVWSSDSRAKNGNYNTWYACGYAAQ